MPLMPGKSKAAFGKNVKTEMEAGKPMKQSLAIAYNMKKKSKKMAFGGGVAFDNSKDRLHADEGHEMDPMTVEPDPRDMAASRKAAGERMIDHDEGINYAKGGKVHKKKMPMPNKDMAEEEAMMASQMPQPGMEPQEPEQPQQPMMARGGELVDKIMSKRMNKADCYSEGGMVANDTIHGDHSIDQYDDLVLRDDLDGTQPEDSNEHGNEELKSEDADMVSKIMASRRKKDRLPNPR